MGIDQCIKQHYEHWQILARKVCRGRFDYNELLHDTLERVLQNKDKVSELLADGKMNNYVCGAIRLAASSGRSSFAAQNKHELTRSTNEVPDLVDQPWMGARLDNETLDALISRLKPEDAELYRDYILPGFSYDQRASELKTPKKSLYKRIIKITNEIRSMVSKPVQDIEFASGGMVMLADVEDKVLYIAGTGSVNKECRMTSQVGKVLRENHGVKDFESKAWKTVHCKSDDKLFRGNRNKIRKRI